jgi:hypothetical protein
MFILILQVPLRSPRKYWTGRTVTQKPSNRSIISRDTEVDHVQRRTTNRDRTREVILKGRKRDIASNQVLELAVLVDVNSTGPGYHVGCEKTQ